MGEIVRIQKYIAMCGKASRRKAEALIDEGRVSLNGERVSEQGVTVEIGADTVAVDGDVLELNTKKYYIMLNKPAGYVSTVSDQFDRPTVIDLVKSEINARIFPVGRLDYETEGLLLLTNDGDFTYHVSHPKFELGKTYIATVGAGLSPSKLNALRRGIKLDGIKTSPAEIEILDSHTRGKNLVKITIHEGKYRQIRRMFDAVGVKVMKLQRVAIGTVELGTLPLGRWRYLTSHEVNYLLNS